MSSFQNKQQERERLGLGRGEEPRKQAEGRLGLNPAFSNVNWMTLSRSLHLSDCPLETVRKTTQQGWLS